MNWPQALSEYARSTNVWVCASETLRSRFPYKDMLDRDAMHVVMVDLCWSIGPVGFVASIHASFSQPNTLIQESVRTFYGGWYNELVTTMPTIKDGYVYPMDGYGLGVELLPAFFERKDLTVRRTSL